MGAAPEAMKTALKRHDRILSEEIRSSGGHVFKTMGDAFCAVFGAPGDAAKAGEALEVRDMDSSAIKPAEAASRTVTFD